MKSDASDNRILECALAAGSEVVVTGDQRGARGFQSIMIEMADFIQLRR